LATAILFRCRTSTHYQDITEEQERSMTLLGRRIEPDEIAPLAVYLASDDARMMTGQAVNLDGGICMA
jgi:NAD(P)-dependent dehydrogenase (short-subunit alcohol dehydrogenase family)